MAAVRDSENSVLKDFLTPYIDKDICGKDLDAGVLNELFKMRLERDSLFTNLPYDVKKTLEHAGQNRLSLFLKNMRQTKIISLENKAQAELEAGGLPIKINGRIDRVDSRDDGRCVIDYKTGRLHLPHKSFWTDSRIWTPVLDNPQDLYHDGAEFLEQTKSVVESLQLPLYLMMYHHTSGEIPLQAALVELIKDGREKFIFDAKTSAEDRKEIVSTKIPALAALIINNMLTEPEFKAIRSTQCDWCPYKEACGV